MIQVAVDIASFVWDREDYNLDSYSYWDMIEYKICLIDMLTKSNSKQLLRNELIEKIWVEFPYSETPTSTRDYTSRVLLYMSKTNFVQYSDNVIQELISMPNQSKNHYSEDINNELQYLLSEIYSNIDNRFYLSFEKVWASDATNLELKNNNTNKLIHTLVINSCNDVEGFFDSYIPKFEHNPKHTRIKPVEYASPLSCYDGADTSIPQKLLSTGVFYKDKYYNYDRDNNVWVIFRNHTNNLYHGYDESNENDIPNYVKKKLNR